MNTALRQMNNGINIAGLMNGVKNGQNGGQRIMNLLPALLALL